MIELPFAVSNEFGFYNNRAAGREPLISCSIIEAGLIVDHSGCTSQSLGFSVLACVIKNKHYVKQIIKGNVL